MTTLYVMCGAPGSGKSTWAHEFQKGRDIDYISRDKIRLSIITDEEHYFSHEDEVYDKFVDEIALGLQTCDVIADATHLSHGARLKLYSALAARGMTHDKYQIIFVQMGTDVEECVRRDDLREGRQHVTRSVVRRMFYQNTHPTVDEFPNVKEVWIINGRNILHQ